MCCVLSCSIFVQFSVTPWTMACQAPLSMEYSRQEYWSGLPFLPRESYWPRNGTHSIGRQILCHCTIVSSVHFSGAVMSDSLGPHESQHAWPPCPTPTPGVYSHSCLLSRCCHPTISSSVVPFSSYPQSFPASGSFPLSQFFASGGQSTGVSASASVLPMNTQDWSPLGWTGWISLQSKHLSRVSSNTTVQKHQFFSCTIIFKYKSQINHFETKFISYAF